MRITMRALYSTPEWTASPGQTITVPGTLGRTLIDRRYAVAADSDPAETPTEPASTPTRKATKRARGRATEKPTEE
ncbi:hypothetical protein [Salininema proteolyticum]|uniref:Uncharacterized protein n=1 Tax=Salininema proteolyticum TaxID=1607685 RepID=A0ABV8TT66_9ACTN